MPREPRKHRYDRTTEDPHNLKYEVFVFIKHLPYHNNIPNTMTLENEMKEMMIRHNLNLEGLGENFDDDAQSVEDKMAAIMKKIKETKTRHHHKLEALWEIFDDYVQSVEEMDVTLIKEIKEMKTRHNREFESL